MAPLIFDFFIDLNTELLLKYAKVYEMNHLRNACLRKIFYAIQRNPSRCCLNVLLFSYRLQIPEVAVKVWPICLRISNEKIKEFAKKYEDEFSPVVVDLLLQHKKQKKFFGHRFLNDAKIPIEALVLFQNPEDEKWISKNDQPFQFFIPTKFQTLKILAENRFFFVSPDLLAYHSLVFRRLLAGVRGGFILQEHELKISLDDHADDVFTLLRVLHLLEDINGKL